MAPMTACVQLTDNPILLAHMVHTLDPIRLQHMASISKLGLYSNKSLFTMPLIVFVVLLPSSTAPKNSVNTAIVHACSKVIEPDPTDVENELLTSLLPIP
eukprot:NODE_298_length_11435_cov_0.210303.p7 type:complete len:100 gc:universal NODE_298_length_11435_cov_0.210303:6276-5977(-)